MRLAILSCGAVVVKEQDQEWLFGAPEGVDTSLKEAGIDVPKFVFLTALRSPGYGKFNAAAFKEKPLSINGLSATPIKHKHGTDYFIESTDARVLFSERGDVAAKDLADYDLCIIKNKHRGDDWDDSIITWPWPDAEYTIADHEVAPLGTTLKVWSSMDKVPSNLKVIEGANLTLAQANQIARVAAASGEGGKENWAIAVDQFKSSHKKDGDKWVKKDTESSKSEEEEPETKEKQAKVSKADANYRPSEGDQKCGNCSYYSGGSCSRVEGSIDPDYISDIYAPAEEVQGMVGNEVSRQATAALKEMTEEGPVQRLGDMLVADLHTAYNDFADQWFKQGYMDENERKKIAGAIGDALKSLRASMPQDLQERVMGAPITVPTAFKELAPDIPDTIDGHWSTVYKSDDGKWHWASITSTAVWDGHDELVTPQAMDWAIKVAKVVGAGPLRFKHAPGLDGGDCTHQACAGGFLFEKGDFDETPIGQAMRRSMQNDPTWMISPGLAFSRKDLIGGVYNKMMVFERSMTKEPANRTTAILTTDGGTEMLKQLTDDELAQVAKDLELEVDYVTKLHQQALSNGSDNVGLKEFKEFVEKESKSGKGKKMDYDEEEEEMTEEEKRTKAKEILAQMDDGQRDVLKELLDETEPPEAKLQLEVSQLKEQMEAQNERMDLMLTLLAGGKTETKEKDLNELLGQLPRKQAQFVSKELGQEPDEADEEIYALLKEIRDEVRGQGDNPFGAGGHIYDVFTSKALNPSRKGN